MKYQALDLQKVREQNLQTSLIKTNAIQLTRKKPQKLFHRTAQKLYRSKSKSQLNQANLFQNVSLLETQLRLRSLTKLWSKWKRERKMLLMKMINSKSVDTEFSNDSPLATARKIRSHPNNTRSKHKTALTSKICKSKLITKSLLTSQRCSQLQISLHQLPKLAETTWFKLVK